MPTFVNVAKGYENLWAKAKLTNENAHGAAKQIIGLRGRYEPVALAIGNGGFWPLIGAIHEREASLSFAGVLHNGDEIIGTGRVTTHVPRGRGPFATWEDAAVDALKLQGWDKVVEWPISRWLYEAEAFNGWGYFAKGINSPYVWAGTNLQQRGKYVSDGSFSPTTWDTQLGVAAILKAIFAIDASLEPGATKPVVDIDSIMAEIRAVLEKHL